MDESRRRFLFVILVFLISFIGVIWRLLVVMVIDREKYCPGLLANRPVESQRANVLDRNGELIAISIPTVSAYAVPKKMQDLKTVAGKISSMFPDIQEEALYQRFVNSRHFIWIKRHLTPAQRQQLLELGIPGIYFINTEKRVYPDKNLCAHVVGFVDVDNVGISGIEKTMDSVLFNSKVPLQLSIDIRVQHAVRDELQKSINKYHALGGGCLVMNIKTGEVVSLVSLPDFDPNIVTDPNKRENFNFLINSALEPGSTAKVINTALALERGKIQVHDKFDARFPLKMGRFTIHDYRGKNAILDVGEILKYSSNIGSAKMALEVGGEEQKAFFKDLGLLDPMSFELTGVQRPLIPKNWSDISVVTISYGHGIAFNPLQFATAVSSLVNGGIFRSPTLIKRSDGSGVGVGRRVISEETSKKLCYLLRLDILDSATKRSEAKGYLVGGKSGTPEKISGKGYNKNANMGCFIAVFPISDPEYVVYVILDDPKGIPETFGFASGAWNAGPTAAAVIKRIAGLLEIPKFSGEEINYKLLLR